MSIPSIREGCSQLVTVPAPPRGPGTGPAMAWRLGAGNPDVHLKLVLICKDTEGYKARVRMGLPWEKHAGKTGEKLEPGLSWDFPLPSLPGGSPRQQVGRGCVAGLLTWHGFFALIPLLELLQLDEAGRGRGYDTGDLGQAAGKGPGHG